MRLFTGIKLARTRAEAMHLASEMERGGMAQVVYRHDTKMGEAMKKAKEWCLDKGIESPECRISHYIDPYTKIVSGHREVGIKRAVFVECA